jgi:membrane protein required for colicin V production
LSKADLFLLVFFLIGAYSGFKEGFLMELFSIIAIVLGVFGGFKLMGWAMIYLQDHFHADKEVLPYIAFIVVFMAIVIIVTLIGRMFKHSIDKSFLGSMDKAMGACLGIFKTAFLFSIIIWIADSLKYSPPGSWTNGSWLYPFTASLAPWFSSWLGGFIPFFKEIFEGF